MAIRELYTSREMHITKEGTTVTQIFSCTGDDWNNGRDSGTTLPIVGTRWSPEREDLRVSDIRVTWRTQSECFVECLYSTQAVDVPQRRPDKVSSIQPSFDIQVQPQTDDDFVDVITENAANWPALWEADESKSGEAPPRYAEQSILTHTFRFNISEWAFLRILTNLNKVNSTYFLRNLKLATGDRVYPDLDISNLNDIGQWLFVGFQGTRLGYRNWELAYTFLCYSDGWNTPHKISASIKAYETTDFVTQLDWPDDFDDSEDTAFRRHGA